MTEQKDSSPDQPALGQRITFDVDKIESLALEYVAASQEAQLDVALLESVLVYRKRHARSFALVIAELHAKEELGRPLDKVAFWSEISATLTWIAMISKVFYPPDKKLYGRGERMRSYFFSPDLAVIADRRARNGIEHYDEIILEWQRANPLGNEAGGIVHRTFFGLPDNEIRRLFDPETADLYFAGRRANLLTLSDSVRNIGNAAASILYRVYEVDGRMNPTQRLDELN